jgi:hypothetical protein
MARFMNIRRLEIVIGMALTIIGVTQWLRHSGGLSSALSTVLLVIGVLATVGGIVSLFCGLSFTVSNIGVRSILGL